MGILSGYMNMLSTLASNDYNSYEADKNRRWQEAMYEKQFSDSQEMWKMQQEYNTPVNQVDRLKKAGINPYLALGNINTGSATSAPSAQAGSGAQATGTPAHFSGVTDALLNLLRNKDERQLLKEQAKNIAADSLSKRIDAMTQHQKNLAEIGKHLSGTDKDKADAALSRTYEETDRMLRGYKVQQYLDESFERTLRAVSNIQSIKAFPERLRLEIAEKTANLALLYQQENLNAEEYRKRVYETVWTEAKAAHAHLDYQTARSIADDIIQQAHWETKSKPYMDAIDKVLDFSREVREWKPTNAKAGKISGRSVRFNGNTRTEYYHYY